MFGALLWLALIPFVAAGVYTLYGLCVVFLRSAEHVVNSRLLWISIGTLGSALLLNRIVPSTGPAIFGLVAWLGALIGLFVIAKRAN